MVADQLCSVGDLLAGVVVEDQEMDAIFPRSHLYVPHVPMLPPVPNMLTCTIRFHLNLYAMHLYALTPTKKICISGQTYFTFTAFFVL